MNKEEYETAENILLSKEVKHFDWLRMKGTTPSVYQAVIESIHEASQPTITVEKDGELEFYDDQPRKGSVDYLLMEESLQKKEKELETLKERVKELTESIKSEINHYEGEYEAAGLKLALKEVKRVFNQQ